MRGPRRNIRERGHFVEWGASGPWSKPGVKRKRSLAVGRHGEALRPSSAGLGAAVQGGSRGRVEACVPLWRMLRTGNGSGAGGGLTHTAPSDTEALGMSLGLKGLSPRMGEGLGLWGPEEGSGLGDGGRGSTFSFEWWLHGSRYISWGRNLGMLKGILPDEETFYGSCPGNHIFWYHSIAPFS